MTALGDGLRCVTLPSPEVALSPEPNPSLAKPSPEAKRLLDRANARGRQGDFAGAIEDFTAVLKIDPRDAQAYYGRGLTRRAYIP